MKRNRQNNNPGAIPGSLIGVRPTVVQKMAHVAAKEGLPGIAEMQGSTSNIFDTVLIADNAAPQVVTLFNATRNKSENFTNITDSLDAGEMNAMQFLTLYRVTLSAADLSDDATTIATISPFVQLTFPQFLHTTMALQMANDVVVKEYQLHETFAPFNPAQCSITERQTQIGVDAVTSELWGATRVPFEAVPMLPPDQKLRLSLRIPPVSGLAANSAIVAVLGRTGSLYASRGTR